MLGFAAVAYVYKQPFRSALRALTRNAGVVGLGIRELGACPSAGCGCLAAIELLWLHYCGYMAETALLRRHGYGCIAVAALLRLRCYGSNAVQCRYSRAPFELFVRARTRFEYRNSKARSDLDLKQSKWNRPG